MDPFIEIISFIFYWPSILHVYELFVCDIFIIKLTWHPYLVLNETGTLFVHFDLFRLHFGITWRLHFYERLLLRLAEIIKKMIGNWIEICTIITYLWNLATVIVERDLHITLQLNLKNVLLLSLITRKLCGWDKPKWTKWWTSIKSRWKKKVERNGKNMLFGKNNNYLTSVLVNKKMYILNYLTFPHLTCTFLTVSEMR